MHVTPPPRYALPQSQRVNSRGQTDPSTPSILHSLLNTSDFPRSRGEGEGGDEATGVGLDGRPQRLVAAEGRMRSGSRSLSRDIPEGRGEGAGQGEGSATTTASPPRTASPLGRQLLRGGGGSERQWAPPGLPGTALIHAPVMERWESVSCGAPTCTGTALVLHYV